MFSYSNYPSSASNLLSKKSMRSPYDLRLYFKRIPPISSSKSYRRGQSSTDLSSIHSISSLKKSSFSKFLAENDIPVSLIQEYLDFLSQLPPARASRLMHDEILSIRNSRSLVQMALSSYQLWLSSMDRIKRLNKESENDSKWKINPVFINEILLTLTDHAYCALVMVENIVAWQASFKSYFFLDEDPVKFVVDGVEVLSEVLKSCDFLIQSELTYYFSFSISDPFLISISKKILSSDPKISTPGRNFHSTRDCKDLFYICIQKEALKKMKSLSKWLFRINYFSNHKKLEPQIKFRSPRKSTGLPSIKQEKNVMNSLACELVANDMVVSIMTEVVQNYFNFKLAEKLSFAMWTGEVFKLLKGIVKECINHEKSEQHKAQKLKEDNLQLSKQILFDLIDSHTFTSLDIPTTFTFLYQQIEQEIKEESQKRLEEENTAISKTLLLDLFSFSGLEDLLTVLSNESIEECQTLISLINEQNLFISEYLYELLMNTYFDNLHIPRIIDEVYQIEESLFITQQKLEESSRNSRNLLFGTLLEAIVRNLVEIEIDSMHELCESTLQDIINEQNQNLQQVLQFKLDTEKIVQSIASQLVDIFVQGKWLSELCGNMWLAEESIAIKDSTMIKDLSKTVERREEYTNEVFTPGIHSPNEISIDHTLNNDIVIDSQSLVEDTPRPAHEFINAMKRVKNPSLQVFDEKVKFLPEVLNRYRQVMQNVNENIVWFEEELLRECEKYWNSYFFWIICEKKIAGMLVYSEDGFGYIINHISVINFLLLKEIIREIPKLINKTECPIKIMFKQRPSGPIEEALKKTGFGLSEELPDKLIYKNKTKEISEQFLMQIKNWVKFETSAEKIARNNRFSIELAEYGNLYNEVSMIYNILEKSSSMDIDENPENKLQEDLNEILAIVLYTNYPKIQNFVIKEQERSGIEDTIIHTSFLKVNLNLFSSIFTSFESGQKYIKIPSKSVKIRTGQEDCRMFLIATSNPDINLFIYDSKTLNLEIEENLRISKTDLFYYTSGLLKSMDDPVEYNKDLLIPCFIKSVEFENFLMSGYQILEAEGKSLFINSCQEQVQIEFNYRGPSNHTLSMGSKVWKIVSDFVFGVIETGIFEDLEIPLLVSRIRKSDWVK